MVEPGLHATSLEADLDFLPGGEATAVEPMSLLSSPAMTNLVQWATETYDRVFVDCPPLIGHADTILMTRQVGDVLLVINSRRTSMGDVQQAQAAMQDVGANILGCVVNFVTAKSIGLADTSHDPSSRKWWKLPDFPKRSRKGKRSPGEASAVKEPACPPPGR